MFPRRSFSAETFTLTLRMPVIGNCIADNVLLRYELLISYTKFAVQSEKEQVHVYAHTQMPCKGLGKLNDDCSVKAGLYAVQF
jgi:hypothetical protein